MKYFYEIRNTKTNECGKACGRSFAEACKAQGWRAKDCRCVWKGSVAGAW